ncbi:hypothetical protein BDN70DRAFT_887756 [Pholiota conissans]|uniref:Uncharacterized protein n=1 Tax=Pholiota conissans TaxID=109636 RepID=A0A9P5YLZ5_9AGAR|nr:hypothetical protein BDN70DRAFT_887756 [Pholiota conissans]
MSFDISTLKLRSSITGDPAEITKKLRIVTTAPFDISSLVLARSPGVHLAPGHALASTTRSAETATIVERIQILFDDTISKQDREDVLNSILLAQIGANAETHPLTQEDPQWYENFKSILVQLHWHMIDTQNEEKSVGAKGTSANEQIIAYMGSRLNPGQTSAVKTALEFFENGLSRQLRGSSGSSSTTSLTQIVNCNRKDEYEYVVGSSGRFVYITEDEFTDWIVTTVHKYKTMLKVEFQNMALDTKGYAAIREEVIREIANFKKSYPTDLSDV